MEDGVCIEYAWAIQFSTVYKNVYSYQIIHVKNVKKCEDQVKILYNVAVTENAAEQKLLELGSSNFMWK